MNHIFRLIFSHTLGSWVAVPETVAARGPSRGNSRRRAKKAFGSLMTLGCALAAPAVHAACSPINPTNGATVTCSGAANPLAPSYASSADNLTVNVVTGGSTGVLLGLGGTAMSLTGNGTTLNNAGTIDPSLLGLLSLLSSGAVIGNPNLGAAIPGSTVNFSNQSSGVLKGTTGLLGLNLADLTGMALAVRNGSGGTTTISNAGTIGSSALLGVSLLGSDAPVIAAYGGAQINFTNTGTITGRTAFETSAAGNTFINAGTISGSVSMGTNSTNTFTAVSGSNVNAGGSLGLNPLGVLGINLSFAPTGQVDGGAGGNNTLVLQNAVGGTGSGTGGTVTTVSSGTYVNFQHLTVNSGTWNLQGALVSSDATLNGGLVNFDSDANFGGSSSITANGGAIAASTAGSTLGKNFTLNAGGLTASGSNSFTLSGVLSGVGTLTKNGSGTLTLSAANGYTGGTIVDGGTVALGANGSLAATGEVNLQGPGATFDISGASANQTIGALAGSAGGTVALGARTLTFGDSTNATYSGAITGAGGIVKQGSGVTTLGGTNTYGGGTTINAGTLAIGAGGSLAPTGAVMLASAGAAFDVSNAISAPTIGALSGVAGSQVALGGNTLTLGGATNTTFAGSIGGVGGSVVKQGIGTFTLSGANTYTGGTTINAGTLALGSGGSLAASAPVTLAAGTNFDLSAAGAQTLGNLAGSGGMVDIGANTLTLAPAGSASYGGAIGGIGGSVVINGAGTQTLTGTNIYSGGTIIQSGTLALGAGGSLAGGGALTLASGGTFDISSGGNQTIGELAGAGGTIDLGANTLSVAGSGGGSFDGVIQGATGGLTNMAGALVLNGANSYGGLTQVQTSQLVVGDATHAGAAVAGDVNVAAGGSLGGFGTIGGGVSVQSGGHLAPGNPNGTLGVNGDLTLAQGSQLDFAFGAPGPDFSTFGAGHNVAVGGNLAINGVTLNAGNAGGFGPGLYNLFTYGGTLTETNGGIVPPAGFTIQNLTASRQINLINTQGLTLNFWNANGLADSTQMGGGSGVWSQANANWTNATGSVTNTRAPADSFVIFGGAPGQVTVDNAGGAQPVTTQGMQFASSGYQLGGDALTLAAPSVGARSEIRVGDGSAASAGWSATIDNVLAGNGLQKTGAGTLVLTGTNTYTQGTQLVAGTLSVSSDASLGNASGNIDFEGGTLRVTGTSYTSTARDIVLGAAGGGVDVAAAANTFTIGQALGGTGGLAKLGAGTLLLTGANTYSGGTALKGGTLAVGNSQALGTGTLAMDDGTTLAFAADGLNLANPVRMTGTNDPIIDTGANTATLSGGIGGAGALTKAGSGTLILAAANNNYTGATAVAAGTLRAGAANALSAGSAHTVNAGATLHTGGFNQTVASLNNAGTVSLLGTAPGSTLTVSGNYAGNGGVLQLGAVLGDSSSASDKLAIGGSASGSTTVQVTNFGGLGAQTTGSGIQLVSAAGGIAPGAFSLAGGHVDAGAYEYRLNNTANASYLSSTSTLAPDPSAAAPMYRSEVPLAAALPAQLRQAGLAMLGNLHQRIGDDDVKGSAGNLSTGAGTDAAPRRAWGRVISTDQDISQTGAVSPSSNGRLDGFQAGTDLWTNPDWRTGIYVGQLDGNVDVNGFARGVQGLAVGSNDLRNQYLGAYGTYANGGGFYADAVLQAGRHRYDVNAISSTTTDGKGSSLLASIEIGQSLAIAPNWQIEPQFQLVHQHLDIDDLALSGATTVQQHPNNGWLARLGVRVKGQLGTVQPYARVNVYRTSNGSDVASFVGPAAITDIASSTGGTSTELAAGGTLKLSDSTSMYGELGKLWANGGDTRIKSGAQGSLGVRVRW
ncbi:MAG: autotransporter outer membrane beta-barrel domain-containing protein [Proteobacteria bacterium]|nr:autotransporter outer membrane beta-barrel domain-containing protein [Pseudomonadota bacterium]